MDASQKQGSPLSSSDESQVNFTEYLDILSDGKWTVITVLVLSLFIGVAYSLFTSPVYEANITAQVEDSDKSAGSFLGDAASALFEVKTPAAGEIEILKSRLILGRAVESTKLYISAAPKYLPVIGTWLARRATALSNPGFLGMSGYVYGNEFIRASQFDVPVDFEGSKFTLTYLGDGKYSLRHPQIATAIVGVVGNDLRSPDGIHILVNEIHAAPGADFELISFSKQAIVRSLQTSIRVAEKGKQSGVLDVTWENTNPITLTNLLNEIGRLYVRQNIERKAAEAEKSLGFLNTELPKFKQQLEQSEDIFNKYRNQNGTVSLDDEAKNALAQTVDLQTKLLDAQQRRRELSARFTDEHPSIKTLDAQIVAWNREIAVVDGRIRKMPMLQQSTLRMQRDIKVNTDLYVSLLNSSLQIRLAKEGRVGNVRILDEAVLPEAPIKPQRRIILAISLIFGLVLGALVVVIRASMFGGIRDPNEIEAHTGLNVYSTIPLSATQNAMNRALDAKLPGFHVLALTQPDDPAIESLRSLNTALKFAMLEASNNRVLVTGATPGVGKSFISVNFACLVAASGKKVLLIDADLRKGRMNQYFSLPRLPGLSEIIAGSLDMQRVLHSNILPNLDLITTGVLPPNPTELLMSESFSKILASVSEAYDLVIIDTAPVLVAADTAAVAPQAATVLLVARAGLTQLGELNESVKRLAHTRSSPAGVILNAMDMTRRHYGSYGYKYGGYRYKQYSYKSIE